MTQFLLNFVYPHLVGACFAWITRPRYRYIPDSDWQMIALCVFCSWIGFVINICIGHLSKIENVWKK